MTAMKSRGDNAAHKKGAGSTKNGRDSNAKRLGVKVYGDQPCNAGSIIIRQRGSKVIAGKNVGTGNDYTLFSKIEGTVKFETKKGRSVVSVYPTVEKVINPDSRRAKKYASYTPRAELRAAIEAANAAA
eukprot:PRCOL_00005417-RA